MKEYESELGKRNPSRKVVVDYGIGRPGRDGRYKWFNGTIAIDRDEDGRIIYSGRVKGNGYIMWSMAWDEDTAGLYLDIMAKMILSHGLHGKNFPLRESEKQIRRTTGDEQDIKNLLDAIGDLDDNEFKRWFGRSREDSEYHIPGIGENVGAPGPRSDDCPDNPWGPFPYN
jgi:hypothetical protein